jgi:Protein of unknown function (DUF998)
MTGVEVLALLSSMAAALWLGIIVVLHFTRPGLDPRTHMISEYAREPGGWIMRLAFFSVALSCGALAAATWAHLASLGLALLAVCGVGFAGAGAFVTDPVLPTQGTQTRSGGLHVLFAFIVITLFPIMATVVGFALASSVWVPIQFWPAALSALTWAGLIGFMGAALYSAKHTETPLGYFQRFMVLTYSVWLMATGLVLTS